MHAARLQVVCCISCPLFPVYPAHCSGAAHIEVPLLSSNPCVQRAGPPAPYSPAASPDQISLLFLCSLLEYLNELQIQTHVAQVLEEAKTNSESVFSIAGSLLHECRLARVAPATLVVKQPALLVLQHPLAQASAGAGTLPSAKHSFSQSRLLSIECSPRRAQAGADPRL